MGCWAIGGPFWDGDPPLGWGEVDDDESTRAIETCLDMGVTYFDTASVYGAGHSERVLGAALKHHRARVVISSKFGPVFNEETRQVSGHSAAVEDIRSSCEASLRRLGTDYIDLLFFHINDYPVEQAGEVRDTLDSLVAEGKILSYGWSTDFADRARFFAESRHCAAVQFQMNVIDENPALVRLCEERDIAGVNRGPLAMGLLTGKYAPETTVEGSDVRASHGPQWMKYFSGGKPSPEWAAKVAAVREILTGASRTLVQGALAWLWARSEKTLPIPGIRTADQARENCGAIDKGPLSAGQMREIAQILGRPD
jgi:aryl-alcohol dehydrogenase-like predicted oxidoreductase